jgi:tetratricopeptide (TPR) repeat protein
MSSRVLLVGLALTLSSGAVAAVESQGTKLGWRYLKEGDYARAERIFEQVLNQDPKDQKAWEGYRAAFSKRKAQEDGTAVEEPKDKEPKSEPAIEDEEPPKKPAKKKKKAADEDEESASASSDEGSSDEKADGPQEIGKIDPAMLRNKRRAKERFEKLRTELSQNYKRNHSGAVEIACTFYTPQLYQFLIENLGAQKGYTVEKAQKLYEASVKDMRNQLEFYCKLTNYSQKPKLKVPIADIMKRVSLVDDEGNSYEPARFKAPKGTDLIGDDAFTVWFNRTDSDGEDIVKKAAKGQLHLVISDLAHEQKQIQLSFKAARLSGDVSGKASSPKSMFERVKDLWR